MKIALAGTAFAILSLASHTETDSPAFAPDDILAWRPQTYIGRTSYERAFVDGRAAVRASCDGSASGLIFEHRIDLRRTPVVEWSWGVEDVFYGEADESRLDGDDYPARLYFVHRTGPMPFSVRAITYVWASRKPVGADWPSAHASQVHVVAVQSGTPQRSTPWVTQRRDVREDFRRYHGLDVDSVDAVAIMTDCDDHGAKATAWYGNVRFLPADGAS